MHTILVVTRTLRNADRTSLSNALVTLKKLTQEINAISARKNSALSTIQTFKMLKLSHLNKF
jgi:hypothetical protein